MLINIYGAVMRIKNKPATLDCLQVISHNIDTCVNSGLLGTFYMHAGHVIIGYTLALDLEYVTVNVATDNQPVLPPK